MSARTASSEGVGRSKIQGCSTESHQSKTATGGCVTRLVLPYPLLRFAPTDKIEIRVCNLKARPSSRESNSRATSKLRTSRESGSTTLSRKALRMSRKKGSRSPLRLRCALAEKAIHYQLRSHLSHERATKFSEASISSRSKEPLY
jgi:hypothetical protein